VIGSPPYAQGCAHQGGADHPERVRQLGRAAYGPGCDPDGQPIPRYGDADGQLANLPEGNLAAVVSSPPFGNVEAAVAARKFGSNEASIAAKWQANQDNPRSHNVSLEVLRRNLEKDNAQSYGDTPGNLGNLDAGGGFDALVSSPPYEGSVNQSAGANDAGARVERMRRAGIDVTNRAKVGGVNGVARQPQAYGDTPGQVGAEAGETFWASARLIVQQCHTLLKPGGVAVWVVKDFVRNKQIVPFAANWQQLGEACGFETIEVIRAWLVKPGPTQLGFAGARVDHTIQRKSFFRRLHERKFPHLAIDWEVVLIQKKCNYEPCL